MQTWAVKHEFRYFVYVSEWQFILCSLLCAIFLSKWIIMKLIRFQSCSHTYSSAMLKHRSKHTHFISQFGKTRNKFHPSQYFPFDIKKKSTLSYFCCAVNPSVTQNGFDIETKNWIGRQETWNWIQTFYKRREVQWVEKHAGKSFGSFLHFIKAAPCLNFWKIP